MAWKKRYSNFRGRTSGYRKRFSGSKGGAMLGMSTPYLLGFAIGLTDIDNRIPAEIKLGLAVLPGSLSKGILGKGKAVAQGMILGDLVQSRTGFNLLGGSGVASGVGSGTW